MNQSFASNTNWVTLESEVTSLRLSFLIVIAHRPREGPVTENLPLYQRAGKNREKRLATPIR